MRRLAVLLTLGFLACSRGSGSTPGSPAPAASSATPPLASATAAPPASSRAQIQPPLLPDGGRAHINSPMAQALGIQYAAQRWPQYHARMATAQHLPDAWKVVIEFAEPVGGHVILDSVGNYVDGGTSAGEH